MQRLFSMFPDGLPGSALVMLRISVAMTIVLHGCARHEDLSVWLLAAIVILSLLLAAGIFTPVLALIAIAIEIIGLWAIGPAGLTTSDVMMVVASTLNALALALLGPGAYSLDARRFGRRVVDLPSAPEK
jgi:uncharacterized membrane protein YphA (DoxX/SURF4 family)